MRSSLVVLVLAVPTVAHADDRCSTADADLAWNSTEITRLSGDTGWFPSGFAAQVRLTGEVAGETTVRSGLRADACWTTGQMTASLSGRPGTGSLEVAYGAQVKLFARIDTTILGNHIYWEGQIPIPFIPDDLMIAGTTAFDPIGATAEVSDHTDPVSLLSTDLIGDLIGIVGISGGLRIAATGSMITSYSDTALHLGDATSTGTFAIARPSGGFTGALETPVSVDGTVHYAPVLSFGVRFDIKILGIRVVDYELFAVPMSLPPIDRSITLVSDAPLHLSLPVLDGIGDGARLDFAAAPTQELVIRNRGELALTIAIDKAPAGVSATALTIQPGRDAHFPVTATELVQLANGATLTLATNDPDHPTLDIALGVDVGGTDPGMVDQPEAGGCASGGGTGSLGFVLVIALGLRVRRGR